MERLLERPRASGAVGAHRQLRRSFPALPSLSIIHADLPRVYPLLLPQTRPSTNPVQGYGSTLGSILGLSVLTLVLQALPSLPLQVVTILIWMTARFFMYASYFAIFGALFGFRNFGRLVAVDNIFNGLFGLLQYPLTYLAIHPLNGNFMWVNLGQVSGWVGGEGCGGPPPAPVMPLHHCHVHCPCCVITQAPWPPSPPTSTPQHTTGGVPDPALLVLRGHVPLGA